MEEAGDRRVPELPGADAWHKLAIFHRSDADSEVTHHQVMLLHGFLSRDDFNIADNTAKCLTVENVVDLGGVSA